MKPKKKPAALKDQPLEYDQGRGADDNEDWMENPPSTYERAVMRFAERNPEFKDHSRGGDWSLRKWFRDV